MNLARFNHVLIPSTKAERDKRRRGPLGRILVEPLAKTYYALSPEGRAAFALAAVAAFSGLDVERSQSSMLWALLFSLILVTLAVRRLFALQGVTIRVSAPERIMAGEQAHFEVCLENRSEREHHAVHVDGPFLPWDGAWRRATASLRQLLPGESRRVTLTARFEARGPHELDQFSASALVPLRLTRGPRLWSAGTRFTVVPRVAPVEPLSLPPAPCYQQGGVARASHTGESLELVGVRPYREGDRLRDLHAKTWARTGKPAVREYHQEYFSRVGVVLDTDGTKTREEEFEAGISLTAGIVSRLFQSEALIDLLITGDQLHALTLGRSLGYLERALDQLASVQPGPPFEAPRVEHLLGPRLSRLSNVILVSPGWDSARDALVRAIERSGVGCRCVAVCAPKRPRAPLLSDRVRVLSSSEVREACETGKAVTL